MRKRFVDADKLNFPDGLWTEVVRRSGSPDWSPEPPTTGPTRLRRAAVIAVAFVVFAAAAVFAWQALAPAERHSRPADPLPSPAEVVEPFETPSFLRVPSEYPAGSDAVMPLTFTDGTQIELIHSRSLPLASLGVRPYVSACGTDLSIVWGDGEGVLYSGEAVQTFKGSGSTDSSRVGLYERAAHVPGHVLVFPFGRWTAGALFQREHDPAIAGCAAGLGGSEDASGFLRLSAVGPISLMEQGHVGGPQMILGEAPPTSITLTAEACSPYEGKEVRVLNGYPVERYEGFAAWCVPEAGVQITVASKDEALIDDVVASVKLRLVE